MTPYLFEHNGERLSLKQWATRTGIPEGTLWGRINRFRWPLSIALTRDPRNREGKRNAAKLTEADVRHIRLSLRGGGVGEKHLARQHRVSLSTIKAIKNRTSWK